MKRIAWVATMVFVAAACSPSHPHAAPASAHPTGGSAGRPRPAAAPPAPRVIRRRAAAHGLRYTITLATPTARAGGLVRMVLQIANSTDRVVDLGACALGAITVSKARDPRPPVTTYPCPSVAIPVGAGRSFTFGASTTAPAGPGHFLVRVTESVDRALPRSLLAPLDLQVALPRAPVAPRTCTATDLRAHGVVGMPAPHVLARHATYSFGPHYALPVDPPTGTGRATLSAARAWQRAAGFVDISPLGTYGLLLGSLQAPPHAPVWVIVVHHTAEAPRGAVTGPVGPTGPNSTACFFTDAVELIRAQGNGDLVASASGDVHRL